MASEPPPPQPSASAAPPALGPRTPAEAFRAFRALATAGPLLAALGPGDPVWLVGGATRDLLLGREPRELDLVVVGPVGELAGRVGPIIASHERFGTVTVAPEVNVRYDLARARRETYARPGALPDVDPTDDLRVDLDRRDLTVNAIAMHVGDGRLVEVEGARDDLAARRLRVLHDRSLLDDPTRVWRIGRYAARLGFVVDEPTRRLAAAADPAAVSGPRHGRELRLALAEPRPRAALRAVQDLNPSFLPPGFDPDAPRLDAALELLPTDGRRDLVLLAAGSGAVALDDLLPWLDALGFSGDERTIVGAGSRDSTMGPLRAARRPSEIRRAVIGVPDEIVALAGGPNARRWLGELSRVRLEIGGDDLLAVGVAAGPEVGVRLRRALERKLDGMLPPAPSSREAELAAALAGPATDA